MAITLNQLIYDLRNTMRSGQGASDDDPISDRLLAFWIHNTRAQLIRQDLNKGRTISDNISQTIGEMSIEKVDASVACGITTGCNTFRTTTTVPSPITISTGDLITRVGPVAVGERPFHLVPISRIPYIGYSPFPAINNAVRASYYNGYIYIFVPQKDRVIKKISVEGVFEDPTSLSSFNNCDGQACYTNDSTYPISAHIVETMKQMIIQTDIKLALGAFSDNTGDGNFSVEPNVERK